MDLILSIPVNYWVIMAVSHMIHIYLKVEADAKSNKEALQEYWQDLWKLGGVCVSFLQSAVMLVASHDAYIKYLSKSEDELGMYYSFAVAFIGYGGSSLWNNLMELIKSKLNVTASA